MHRLNKPTVSSSHLTSATIQTVLIDNKTNSNNNLSLNRIDYDTTSIASISESSHWSGGNGDDLDNIALGK